METEGSCHIRNSCNCCDVAMWIVLSIIKLSIMIVFVALKNMHKYFKTVSFVPDVKGIIHAACVKLLVFKCVFHYKTVFLRTLMFEDGKFIY